MSKKKQKKEIVESQLLASLIWQADNCNSSDEIEFIISELEDLYYSFSRYDLELATVTFRVMGQLQAQTTRMSSS